MPPCGIVALWAVFEWRVHSENKAYMRLAGLGTAAVGGLIAAFLTGARPQRTAIDATPSRVAMRSK